MMTCPKCGCEVDDMADCCPGCLAPIDRRKASTMALLGLRYESKPKPTPPDAEPQINPELREVVDAIDRYISAAGYNEHTAILTKARADIVNSNFPR